MEPEQVSDVSTYTEMAGNMIQGLTVDELADLLYAREAYRQQAVTPEAIGSCSTYMVGPGGAEVLVTSRGATLDWAWANISEFIRDRVKEGFKPVVKNQYKTQLEQSTTASSGTGTTVTQTHSAPQQSVQNNTVSAYEPNKTGDMVEFDCDTVEVTMARGKYYYKIHSVEPRFKQYGVTAWPEVFRSVGIAVDDDNPLQDGLSLVGYKATALMGPSKNDPNKIVAQKVVSLKRA